MRLSKQIRTDPRVQMYWMALLWSFDAQTQMHAPTLMAQCSVHLGIMDLHAACVKRAMHGVLAVSAQDHVLVASGPGCSLE